MEEYVKKCTICQQAKVEHTKLPALLQPLTIPKEAWTIISLDFIEGLPKSQSYDVILVVIDKYTKYGHFIPLRHPFTAPQVAQAFINNVYKLHGMPRVIISDGDKIFTSTFWQELCRLSDTTLNMSSAHHAQTDGQTERLNQCLETFLRCMVHSCPQRWNQWLPLAEFWYNTTFHYALNKSPFQVLYGHEPRHLGISNIATSPSPDIQHWLQDHADMATVIQQQLQRAQQRMKSQADKKRTERQFYVGDKVYLKLQPYIQMTVARRSNQKLSFKYFGPYEILQKIGAVAYKLKLPEGSRIHPVVHVSMLKKAISPATEVCPDIPPAINDMEHVAVPESILDRRLVQEDNHVISRVLVKWRDLLTHLATWEDVSAMEFQFSGLLAWGQANTYGGGNVTGADRPATTNTEEEISPAGDGPRRSTRPRKPVKRD